MMRKLAGAVTLLSLCASVAIAQPAPAASRAPVTPAMYGDASGGPAGCGAADAVTALQTWFRAVSTGDTTLVRKAIGAGLQWVSVAQPLARYTEPQFVGRDLSSLIQYAAARGRVHESIELLELTFNGWRQGDLQIGPLSYRRTADDLGAAPLVGIGKAAYTCGEGLIVLSLGTPKPQ